LLNSRYTKYTGTWVPEIINANFGFIDTSHRIPKSRIRQFTKFEGGGHNPDRIWIGCVDPDPGGQKQK